MNCGLCSITVLFFFRVSIFFFIMLKVSLVLCCHVNRPFL